MLRCRIAYVAIVACLGTAQAATQNGVQQLLDRQRYYDELCRGMLGDDLHMVEACDIRDRLDRKLNALGWCFGRHGQPVSEMAWHACEDDSLRR
jgi:hypothetical protein